METGRTSEADLAHVAPTGPRLAWIVAASGAAGLGALLIFGVQVIPPLLILGVSLLVFLLSLKDFPLAMAVGLAMLPAVNIVVQGGEEQRIVLSLHRGIGLAWLAGWMIQKIRRRDLAPRTLPQVLIFAWVMVVLLSFVINGLAHPSAWGVLAEPSERWITLGLLSLLAFETVVSRRDLVVVLAGLATGWVLTIPLWLGQCLTLRLGGDALAGVLVRGIPFVRLSSALSSVIVYQTYILFGAPIVIGSLLTYGVPRLRRYRTIAWILGAGLLSVAFLSLLVDGTRIMALYVLLLTVALLSLAMLRRWRHRLGILALAGVIFYLGSGWVSHGYMYCRHDRRLGFPSYSYLMRPLRSLPIAWRVVFPQPLVSAAIDPAPGEEEAMAKISYGNSVARLVFLRAGLAMFTEHPIVGRGAGAFQREFGGFLHQRAPRSWASYFRTGLGGDLSPNSHNSLLSVAVGTGSLGMAAFLGLLTAALGSAVIACCRNAPGNRYLGYGLILGIAAFLLLSLTEDLVFVTSPVSKLFWITLGLLFRYPYL